MPSAFRGCWKKEPRRSRWPRRLVLEYLEDRTLLSGAPPLPAQVNGTLLSSVQVDPYPFTIPATQGSSRLTAKVLDAGSTLVPQLQLDGADGKELFQSADGSIVQVLQPGTYSLTVSARAGTGGYQLSTEFVPVATTTIDTSQLALAANAGLPLEPVNIGAKPGAVVVADLTGKGPLDLVVSNPAASTVSVLLGNGDGTFQPAQTLAVGKAPTAVVVADLSNGHPDLVVANAGANSVSVLLGDGHGSFLTQQTFSVGPNPASVAVADVNGDGKPDLVVASAGTYDPATHQVSGGGVGILFGDGKGSFTAEQTLALGNNLTSVAVADVNGDGLPDVVVANRGAYDVKAQVATGGSVGVLLGKGHGSFQSEQSFAPGSDPASVAVADVNGDGKADLVVTNYPGPYASGDTVTVLLNSTESGGNLSFRDGQALPVDTGSVAVSVADLNHDGKPDLLVTNKARYTVTVLLNETTPDSSTASFVPQPTFRVGARTNAVVVADLTGDGKPDLLVADQNYTTANLFPGNGDGSFHIQPTFRIDRGPASVAVADVNGDGKPDLVSANLFAGTVSVLLGQGDGTFAAEQSFPVGNYPAAVAVADLNGDGKLDLVVANEHGNTLSVLLGNGDGTFQPQQTFTAGLSPQAVAVADLNGDGKPDLVVVNSGSNTLTVLPANGDGTFQPAQTFAVGKAPAAVVVADLGNGHADLVVANAGDNSVSVLLGDGHGSLSTQQTFSVGPNPASVAVADVNGDGKPDLVTANTGDNTVSVLLGDGHGSFQTPQTFSVGPNPGAVAVADVNGDGKPDLVVVNQGTNGSGSDTVSVLANKTGRASPTFATQQTFAVGLHPSALAVADVNGDGQPDLVVANKYNNTLSVLLGNDGSFTPSTPGSGVGLRSTPYLADLDGDGLADSVILDGSGNVLFRKGLPGPDDQFAPPVIINPQQPARDLTLLDTATGWVVAAADARGGAVSLYRWGQGAFYHSATFPLGPLPQRIAAADLTGNGREDLVVSDGLDHGIRIVFQQADGNWSLPLLLTTGETVSDIALVDVNGDHLRDIVVSDQTSGEVSVFLNDPNHSFATVEHFRASPGQYDIPPSPALGGVQSEAVSVALAVGDLTGEGRNDLVVVNRGEHSFTVLPNDGDGGFADPEAALTTSTSDGLTVNQLPGPIVSGDFNGDGKMDLAILMEDRGEVWIYSNDGQGHFSHTSSAPAGSGPTGLTVVRNTQTGYLDLLVGNPFGDVLRLQGQGDGTFQFPGSHTSLAVQPDLFGPGRPGVLVGNQAGNSVTVQSPLYDSTTASPAMLPDGRPWTAFAPGDVQWARLDGVHLFAVVVDSGANQVQVARFLGVPNGVPLFDTPHAYFVGTDPVSVTVAFLDDHRTPDLPPGASGPVTLVDRIPDLVVANQGSNDVSILFGQGDGSFQPGPRLKSGGFGPVDVTVRDQANGLPQLVVTNGSSGTITGLPGVGQGFFNDQSPQSLVDLGTPVTTAPVLTGPSGNGVVATVDGRLLGFQLPVSGVTDAHPVFAPPDLFVTAVQALSDGRLVVAERGGGVQVLQGGGSSTEDVVVQTLAPEEGYDIPSAPSALAVLESADSFQVLVTNEGSNELYLYAPVTLAGPEGPATARDVALPVLPAVSPVLATAMPAEAPLALVFTFAPGTLPVAETAPTGEATLGGEPTANDSSPSQPAAVEGSNSPLTLVVPVDLTVGGADEEDPTPQPQAAAQPPTDFDPDVKEWLRQLDLFFGTDPQAAMSHQALPAPEQAEIPPAALRQARNDLPLPPQSTEPGAEVVGTPAARPPAMDPVEHTDPEDFPSPEIVLPTASDFLREHSPLLATLAAGGLALWTERWRDREKRVVPRPTRGPRLPRLQILV